MQEVEKRRKRFIDNKRYSNYPGGRGAVSLLLMTQLIGRSTVNLTQSLTFQLELNAPL